MPFISVGGIKIPMQVDLGPFQAGLVDAVKKSKHWAKVVADVMKKGTSSPADMTRANAAAAAAGIRANAAAASAAARAQASAQAQATRARGSSRAQATRARAQAQATKHRARVLAPAQAQATRQRAAGAARASVLRAQGAAQAGIIRAQGNKSSQMVRAQGYAAAQRIKAILSPFSSLAGKLGGGGGGIGGLLAAGVGGFTAYTAFDTFKDEAIGMETRLMKLNRVTDMSAERFANLRQEILQTISHTPGTDIESIFGIAQMGAKMGVSGNALGLWTRDLSKMRAVLDETDMPLEEMATGVARMATVFGDGYDKAHNYLSVLLKLDQASTASARDILNISQRMAGFAATFGATARQTMAIATALRQAGIPVETAGTSVGQILQRMASPRDMGQFAKIAGVSKKQFRQQIQANPLEAMTSVGRGLAKMDPMKASAALEKVHLDGQRVRGTLLGLGRVLDELGKYNEIANEEWTAGSYLTKAFGMTAATTAAQLDLMVSNLRLTAESIGRTLLPVIKGFANGMIGLASDLKKFFEENQEGILKWTRWIGQGFLNAGVALRRFPDVMEWVLEKSREILDRFVAITARYGIQIWDNLVAEAGNLEPILENVFEATFKATGSAMHQHGRNMALELARGYIEVLHATGLWKFLPGFMANQFQGIRAQIAKEVLRPIRPDFSGFAPDQLGRGVKRRGPGFNADAVFKDLPNRRAQLGPIEQRLGMARRGLDAERGGEAGGLNAKNKETRDQIAREQATRANAMRQFGAENPRAIKIGGLRHRLQRAESLREMAEKSPHLLDPSTVRGRLAHAKIRREKLHPFVPGSDRADDEDMGTSRGRIARQISERQRRNQGIRNWRAQFNSNIRNRRRGDMDEPGGGPDKQAPAKTMDEQAKDIGKKIDEMVTSLKNVERIIGAGGVMGGMGPEAA